MDHPARRGGAWPPPDPSTPQTATTSQLRELVRRAFHAESGYWPVSVTLAVVRYKQRFRFQVVTADAEGEDGRGA